MDGITLIISVVALAVGFIAGVFVEHLIAELYISQLKEQLDVQKKEHESKDYKVIEIIDHTKEQNDYFIPF